MKKTLWILGIVAALVVVDAFSNRYFSRALSSDFEVSYLKFDKGWVYFQVKNTGKMIYTGGYAKIVDLETGASLYGGNFPDGFHSDRFLSKPDSPSFDKALLKSRETAYKRYKIMDAG
ncbi:MAG: hypothetical protein U1D99_11450, partial [Candidatus Omnitrophota bacterium]|nr:hypothetical protein [Candidatus Omnitrophota bacterium]